MYKKLSVSTLTVQQLHSTTPIIHRNEIIAMSKELTTGRQVQCMLLLYIVVDIHISSDSNKDHIRNASSNIMAYFYVQHASISTIVSYNNLLYYFPILTS